MICHGVKELVAKATSEIETIPIEGADLLIENSEIILVDIRDVRELERDGTIPGSVHVPRGMLEFWVDPESPYHRKVFASDKTFVFFCASAWRSALATKTVQDMGLRKVAQLEGGLGAWKKLKYPIEKRQRK